MLFELYAQAFELHAIPRQKLRNTVRRVDAVVVSRDVNPASPAQPTSGAICTNTNEFIAIYYITHTHICTYS